MELESFGYEEERLFQAFNFSPFEATGGLHNRLLVRKSSYLRGKPTLKLGLVRLRGEQEMSSPPGWQGVKPQRIHPNMLLLQHLPRLAKNYNGLTGVTAQAPQIRAAMLQGLFQTEPEQGAGHNRSKMLCK